MNISRTCGFLQTLNFKLKIVKDANQIIFILAISIFLYSCEYSSNYKNAHLFSNENIPLEKNLKGKVLDFDELIMMPVELSIVDSVLLLLNIRTELFVHKFNINSFKKIGESVPFGSGPGEMLDARKIQPIDSSIWLFDKMNRKIHQYEIFDFCFSDHPEVKNMMKYSRFLDDLSILPDNKYVATTIEPNTKRLIFFDMEGNQLFEKGEFPDDGTEKTDLEKTQGANCSMIVNILEKKICLAYKLTDLIEIYDMEGNLLKRVHGPDHFFAQLRQRNLAEDAITVTSSDGKTRSAYYFPVSYDNKIWVLYSGKYFGESDVADHLLNTIIVFDWDGNPLCHYKLDVPIFAFTIDKQNNKIYGITENPENQIIQFDL